MEMEGKSRQRGKRLRFRNCRWPAVTALNKALILPLKVSILSTQHQLSGHDIHISMDTGRLTKNSSYENSTLKLTNVLSL